MDERYDIQKLLLLRKLTRELAELLRGQLREYLSALAPLVRPGRIFGEYVMGGGKEGVRNAEEAFKELQNLYASVAAAKPFGLPHELKPPVEVVSATLELTPVVYGHAAHAGGESKEVMVTSPLKLALTYSGFPAARLRELLSTRNRQSDELQQFVLHYLMLHLVLARQPGVTQILGALHFPVKTETAPELGGLPLTYVTAALSTMRPPDDVIIESTEVSGMPVFEEVVRVEDIMRLDDPLKARLIDLAKRHGADILA